MFLDFVVEAPARFSHEIRRATETVLPDIGAAVIRTRFLFQEIMTEAEVVAALRRIARRGSQGVCLKARDLPSIRDAVNALSGAGIPVVTLVTDIPASNRTAYVGLDNFSAGRTAAYLMARFLREPAGTILTTRSQDSFLGEEERARGFTESLRRFHPRLKTIDVSGGSGVPYATAQEIEKALDARKELCGVYSMGGGNRAILQTLAHHGLSPEVYVAHDLDAENRDLLRNGGLTAVLHHDLRTDIRNAIRVILHVHGLLPAAPIATPSDVQIITPENMPVV